MSIQDFFKEHLLGRTIVAVEDPFDYANWDHMRGVYNGGLVLTLDNGTVIHIDDAYSTWEFKKS